MTETETVWVSTTSHRSRDRLRRLVGDPGPSYGIWPKNGWPHGCYYEVPAGHAAAASHIPGARVLRRKPAGELFRYLTSADLGGPERGHWPVTS